MCISIEYVLFIHIYENIHYILFCIWLLSLNTMFLRYHLVVACVRSLSFRLHQDIALCGQNTLSSLWWTCGFPPVWFIINKATLKLLDMSFHSLSIHFYWMFQAVEVLRQHRYIFTLETAEQVYEVVLWFTCPSIIRKSHCSIAILGG